MSDVTRLEILRIARELYADGPIVLRSMQRWRPYICPFADLVMLVPKGSSVLDIGCGAGLFLGLLAALGRIRGGVGFDASAQAVGLARSMSLRLPDATRPRFLHSDVSAPWPNASHDVVSLVDVAHHVAPKDQLSVIDQAVSRVAPGGRFLYKDIAARPFWRGTANRLHDLIIARQWIHYLPISTVIDRARTRGLELEASYAVNTFWYRHEIAVLVKPNCRDSLSGSDT